MTHETLARRFFYFDRWLGDAPFGNGNINDTYRIEFEREGASLVYLLQRLNHHVFRDPYAVMRNMQNVCTHLAASSYIYRVAAPVPGLDGELLQRDETGNYWRVFPLLENTFAPEGVADAAIAREAARAYGAFSRALRDFPALNLTETIPGFHDTGLRWQFFLEIMKENPAGRLATSRPEIEAVFSAKPVFDFIGDLKKSGRLPLRVTHNDTKAGNVLFDCHTRRAVAVIDLDTVMPGTILSDFGDMVRTFATDRAEDASGNVVLRADILEALKSGFLETAGSFLTETERQHFVEGAAWIIGEQALRFLTDWLAGDTYYKIRYPEHNLVRTRNQLALLREIMRVMP
jgi:hypothetical protein